MYMQPQGQSDQAHQVEVLLVDGDLVAVARWWHTALAGDFGPGLGLRAR